MVSNDSCNLLGTFTVQNTNVIPRSSDNDNGHYIVTGAPRSEFLEGLSIIGVQQIDRVVEVVEETLKGG